MRWPHSEGSVMPLRGGKTPHEGAGQLPALLLENWGSYLTNYLPH
jgi:hypothetical protein